MRATIELAHALRPARDRRGRRDAATVNVLRGMGCDLAQGFFIAEPMADSATEKWLAESSWAVAGA